MSEQQKFKKSDRVVVSTTVSDYTGQIGTVMAVSRWVFAHFGDICYLVDLDSGESVTCDAEDLSLVEEGK